MEQKLQCMRMQKHASNCRLDCRHFLKQLATLLCFSSSPCPCPSQSPEAHLSIDCIITHTVLPFQQNCRASAFSFSSLLCSLCISALRSAAAAALATRRHMLLPCERSGNKCATNGGPSTPPYSSFSSCFSSSSSSC